MIYIGLDDTDNLESRGTGHLARMLAEDLGRDYPVFGVTRHQLLFDSRIPCTKKNSCAAIAVGGSPSAEELMARVRDCMLADFQTGSDPGLCVSAGVPAAITDFGRRAQREILIQEEARRLAAEYGLLLEGLGGTEDGVIGALAAVGLAACGEDGRYVQVGSIRELQGLVPWDAVLAAGVRDIQTLDGRPVREGLVAADKLRPARRRGIPIAYVDWCEDHWLPVKLD